MGFNDTLQNAGVNAMQALATHMSLHTATPNASGSNESTAARVAAAWPTAANGDFGALSNKAFTGGASSGPVTHVGFWSASSGGTYYGAFALTGDATFNSAGEYTLVSGAITGTSTG